MLANEFVATVPVLSSLCSWLLGRPHANSDGQKTKVPNLTKCSHHYQLTPPSLTLLTLFFTNSLSFQHSSCHLYYRIISIYKRINKAVTQLDYFIQRSWKVEVNLSLFTHTGSCIPYYSGLMGTMTSCFLSCQRKT